MKKSSLVLLLAVCAMLFLFSSCGKADAASNPYEIKSDAKDKDGATKKPTSYGNGVYYFPSKGTEFAASLAHFLDSDSTIAVETMAAELTVNGNEAGFIVVMKKK